MKPDTIRVVTQPFYANGLPPQRARVLPAGARVGILDRDDTVTEIEWLRDDDAPGTTFVVFTPDLLRFTAPWAAPLIVRLTDKTTAPR